MAARFPRKNDVPDENFLSERLFRDDLEEEIMFRKRNPAQNVIFLRKSLGFLAFRSLTGGRQNVRDS